MTFKDSNTNNMVLYSHVNIILDHHQPENPAVEVFHVVSCLLDPLSIKHEFQGGFD